ncbi:MAG: flagellar hook-basal body complex protein FliE [Desulfobacteraceae bacterium]|nr:flagellar hook-basal body complex protein FliE [Desulfobacteraceae bacterium]MBU4053568.1 flagellar hook-basal body complex protein FliE [Pseudomonadota bacterium]
MDSIKSLQNIQKVYNNPFIEKSNERTDNTKSFGKMLTETIKEVDSIHKESDKMINGLASGQNTDIHNTMIAVEKADISFQLMMQIRNKLVSAYQEVYRMQI